MRGPLRLFPPSPGTCPPLPAGEGDDEAARLRPCGQPWDDGVSLCCGHGLHRARAPRGPIDPLSGVTYLTAMAKLPIITLPDPLLRETSKPVETIDADLQRLIDDMLETMYAAPGVGLAAIQVGVPRRLLVLDVEGDEEKRQPIAMINPEILTLGPEKRVYEEGCLSIPDVRIEIERPSTLSLRYTDRDGRTIERDAEGLLATAIQHELDHLDGRLIIDFLSRLKRDMVVRRFKKQARADA